MTNRPLTQEELDLAPKWATHYIVDEEGDVCFENTDYEQWVRHGLLRSKQKKSKLQGLYKSSNPIPELSGLDVMEWSYNSGILDVSVTGDNSGIVTTYTGIGDIYDTKQDIINKAKALGITWEDLK